MGKSSTSQAELAALELFEAASMLRADQREAFIAAHDGYTSAIRERALALLQADRDGMAGLRTGGAGTTLYDRDDDPPEIDGYEMMRMLGRGGMGAVWLARRKADDFTHLVAIKIIRPGVLSDGLIERFLRERQILARLNHPHIARLYDGGETLEKQPYIVMEYIAGQTLRQWLAERPHAPLQERMALFRQIALAVEFAHQNLVVHRDLTTGNVLIDEHGQAKLIDFGIARPPRADDEQSAASAITGLSLTPGFAAPERALGEASNTLSDIFSLGRILEAMTGDVADPELRAVAARAAAHDPARRYTGVGDLIDDLDRHAAGRAIDSFSTSRRYRFGKFVRREKLLVASGAALVFALTAGLAGSSWSYLRAERARAQAEQRFSEVRDMAKFMLFDLDSQLQRVAGNTTARTALAMRAQRYLSALAGSRLIDPALRLEAARGFTRLAQVQGSPITPNLGLVDDARANLVQADALLQGLPSQATEAQIERARVGFHRAMIALHADADQESATRFMTAALAALGDVRVDARDRGWRLTQAELRLGEADILTLSGQFAELERLADRVESDIAGWPKAEQNSRAAEFGRANAEVLRGRAMHQQGRALQAIPPLRTAERRYQALDAQAPNDPLVLNALAWAAYEGYGAASVADPAESSRFLNLARDTVDRLVALESSDKALRSLAINVRQAQAEGLGAERRYSEAIALQSEVVVLRRATAAATPDARALSRLGVSAMILGDIAMAGGRPSEACIAYRQSDAAFVRARALGPLVGMNQDHALKVRNHLTGCA